MADNKDIAFKVTIGGIEQSITTVKDLKGAIKSLNKEIESSDFGSEQYNKAAKSLEDVKGKMDSLNDSTQALKGTGIEVYHLLLGC